MASFDRKVDIQLDNYLKHVLIGLTGLKLDKEGLILLENTAKAIQHALEQINLLEIALIRQNLRSTGILSPPSDREIPDYVPQGTLIPPLKSHEQLSKTVDTKAGILSGERDSKEIHNADIKSSVAAITKQENSSPLLECIDLTVDLDCEDSDVKNFLNNGCTSSNSLHSDKNEAIHRPNVDEKLTQLSNGPLRICGQQHKTDSTKEEILCGKLGSKEALNADTKTSTSIITTQDPSPLLKPRSDLTGDLGFELRNSCTSSNSLNPDKSRPCQNRRICDQLSQHSIPLRKQMGNDGRCVNNSSVSPLARPLDNHRNIDRNNWSTSLKNRPPSVPDSHLQEKIPESGPSLLLNIGYTAFMTTRYPQLSTNLMFEILRENNIAGVTDVIVFNKTSRSHAFVSFDSLENFQNALQLGGTILVNDFPLFIYAKKDPSETGRKRVPKRHEPLFPWKKRQTKVTFQGTYKRFAD